MKPSETPSRPLQFVHGFRITASTDLVQRRGRLIRTAPIKGLPVEDSSNRRRCFQAAQKPRSQPSRWHSSSQQADLVRTCRLGVLLPFAS